MAQAATTGTTVVRPASVAEAADVLLQAAVDGACLLFRGAGTKLDWGAPPRAGNLVVESTGLDRILAHDAADMTVAVQAGVPLLRLQQSLARSGQWLALDPPSASRGATIGGLIAAGDHGPRRMRYGAMRDLVIGITVVLADGSVAHSGGRVIKNVAGYDLGRLFHGSLGTLGFIAEAVLRLHPRPPISRTVRFALDADASFGLAMEVCGGASEPTALEWCDGALLVRVEGEAGAADAQVDAVLTVGARHRATGELLVTEGEAAAWEAVERHLDGEPGDTIVRAGTLPSRLPEVEETLRRTAAKFGIEARLCSSVALGVHTARLRGGTATEHALCLAELQEALGSPDRASVTVHRRADGLADVADLWGAPPTSLPLMRSVKQQFDPDDRCAPGRFSPWF